MQKCLDIFASELTKLSNNHLPWTQYNVIEFEDCESHIQKQNRLLAIMRAPVMQLSLLLLLLKWTTLIANS